MRTLLLLFFVLLFASFTRAQDDAAAQAAQAAQQAAMQAMQASQQAMPDAMRANQAASDQMTEQMTNNLNDASQNAGPVIWLTAKPRISVKPGTQKNPITIKLSDSTRGAIMYYTTNGWTPTAASHRYVGPITIDSTTNLQVVTSLGLLGLRGAATLEGQANLPNAAAVIPVVGPFTLFRPGKDADIKTGTPFTAYLVPPTLEAASH